MACRFNHRHKRGLKEFMSWLRAESRFQRLFIIAFCSFQFLALLLLLCNLQLSVWSTLTNAARIGRCFVFTVHKVRFVCVCVSCVFGRCFVGKDHTTACTTFRNQLSRPRSRMNEVKLYYLLSIYRPRTPWNWLQLPIPELVEIVSGSRARTEATEA